MTKPEQCPKYERCNAPICPLHDQWRRARHLSEESICFWLREWSKTGGPARVRLALPGEPSEAVSVAYAEIMQAAAGAPLGLPEVRRKLERAAQSPSKLVHGQQLRKTYG